MFNVKVQERQKLGARALLGPRPCGGADLRGVWLARTGLRRRMVDSSAASGNIRA